jgi:hypothetical protein
LCRDRIGNPLSRVRLGACTETRMQIQEKALSGGAQIPVILHLHVIPSVGSNVSSSIASHGFTPYSDPPAGPAESDYSTVTYQIIKPFGFYKPRSIIEIYNLYVHSYISLLCYGSESAGQGFGAR